MINFRFHLISLIAVFLALAIGIVVGSTVVDDAIVARLERDIEDVREESQARAQENDELRDELAVLRRYADESAAFAVEARLAEVPVAVVAERGVDGDIVRASVDLLRAAGADVPGVVWLEESWRLEDADQVRTLKEVTGATGSKVAARALALDALATRFVEGPPVPVEGEEAAVDLLFALRDAGFVGLDGDEAAFAAFPAHPARALLVTGATTELADVDMTVATARAFTDVGLPTAVGEAYVDDGDDAVARGAAVAPVRLDDDLAEDVATVDDLDLVQGRVAAVLVLEDVANGFVGHYGYGNGADAPVPEQQA